MPFLVTPLWWLVVQLLVLVCQGLPFVYRSMTFILLLLVLLHMLCTLLATLALLPVRLLLLPVQWFDRLTDRVSRAVEAFVFVSMLQLCSPMPFFKIGTALGNSRARDSHAFPAGVFSSTTDALCRHHHFASRSVKSVASKALAAMTWQPAMFKVVTYHQNTR